MTDLLSDARKAFTRPRLRIQVLEWQSPTRLLGLGHLPSGTASRPFRLTLFALDLPAGKVTPLSYPKPFFRAYRGTFSPDGGWLLQCSDASDTPLCVQALCLDGKRRQLWTLDTRELRAPGRLWPATGPVWMPDGRSWALLASRNTKGTMPPLMAVTGRLGQPGPVRTTPLGLTSPATGGYFDWDSLHMSQLLGSPDGDQLVGMSPRLPQPGRPQLVCYTMHLSRQGRDRREEELRIDLDDQGGEDVTDAHYCPTTGRLALLLEPGQKREGFQRLFVLSRDRRQKVMVGQIQGRREQFAERVQWLPGGRQLSFECQDVFWILDIPPERPSDARLITTR